MIEQRAMCSMLLSYITNKQPNFSEQIRPNMWHVSVENIMWGEKTGIWFCSKMEKKDFACHLPPTGWLWGKIWRWKWQLDERERGGWKDGRSIGNKVPARGARIAMARVWKVCAMATAGVARRPRPHSTDRASEERAVLNNDEVRESSNQENWAQLSDKLQKNSQKNLLVSQCEICIFFWNFIFNNFFLPRLWGGMKATRELGLSH